MVCTAVYHVMSEMKWPKTWPVIPEIEVEFKPAGQGGLVTSPGVDLGVLGEWEFGEIRIKEDSNIEEAKPEIRAQVQKIFKSLLLRAAAVILVNQDQGVHPIVVLYDAYRDELQALAPQEAIQ